MEAHENTDTLKKGDMLNWYRIERILGRGGFGVTYLALDSNLDLQVAIKEYLPEQIAKRDDDNSVGPLTANEQQVFNWGLKRFIIEARTLVKFKHRNIVRVMSVFESNKTAYMVMEFESGQDLKQLLAETGNKSEQFLKQLITPINDGLAEVHRHGFIHRDIKPANIYIRENGTPVLLDFGSARQALGSQTQQLTAMVSSGYAPLEQYNGSNDSQQGPWTDIYALGAVLYYAITGTAPLDAMLRASAVLNDQPDPLQPLAQGRLFGYSEQFLSAIDWALSSRVADRPISLETWGARLLSDDQTVIMPKSGNSHPTVVSHETLDRFRSRIPEQDPSKRPLAGRTLPAQSVAKRSPQSIQKESYERAAYAAGGGAVRSSSANDASSQADRRKPIPPTDNARPDVARAKEGLQLDIETESDLSIPADWDIQSKSQRHPIDSPVWTARSHGSGSSGRDTRNVTSVQSTSRGRPKQGVSGWLIATLVVALFAAITGYQLFFGLGPQNRAAEQATMVEKARRLAGEQQETAALAEAKRLAEQQKRAAVVAEAERLAAEQKKAAAVAEAERFAEQQKKVAAVAEAERLAEQQKGATKVAEAERLAEHQKRATAVAEAKRQAQATKRAEEEKQKLVTEGANSAKKQNLADAKAASEALASPESKATGNASTIRAFLSDEQIQQGIGRFNALSKAIEQKDTDQIARLTVNSDSKNGFLSYVFDNFVKIDVALSSISIQRSRHLIKGRLEVRELIKANGDRAKPARVFRSIPLSSERIDGQWSPIVW